MSNSSKANVFGTLAFLVLCAMLLCAAYDTTPSDEKKTSGQQNLQLTSITPVSTSAPVSTTIPQARDEDLMQADIEYYQECEYIITVENHSGHERSVRITTEKGSREVAIPGWRTSSETQYEPVAHVEITTLSGKILKRKMLSMPIQCHNGVNLTRVPH